jgi:hypothetical protein
MGEIAGEDAYPAVCRFGSVAADVKLRLTTSAVMGTS